MTEPTEMELRVAMAIRISLRQQEISDNFYVPEARAAIRAMREPTEGMLKAGRSDGMIPFGATECWKPMIDAASPEHKP